ncbi:MAG: ATP-binding protein [Caldilineaceae bacterium]|nr:ATP-binding protein [Caldilineaceae bacterium]
MLKPLPIGTAVFRDMIQGGYLYIDKTRYIYELVRPYKGVYFLSRPRRFGKSLMISTLSELFQGNRELFKGLWIEQQTDYDWPQYPVIRLDLGATQVGSADELQKFLDFEIERIAQTNSVALRGFNPSTKLSDLIRQLAAGNQDQRVVILIDEYDKPILDNLDDLDEAEEIRKVLKGFYGVIKAMDQYIRFVFITGISKFTKVSIFSDLNNLDDLTLQTSMAAALGLTEAEISEHFRDYIDVFAGKEGMTNEAFMDKMRTWYNGFCFAPDGENVYNPFSTLLLFKTERFANHWFETGTPNFLVRLIRNGNPDVERYEALQVVETAFSIYDIRRLSIVPLLFQTGYLTIKNYDKERQLFTLSYPNYEVRNAFLSNVLDVFSNLEQGFSASYLWQLIDALQRADLEQFFTILRTLYANIDYDLQLNHEKYYQTIFYLIFKLIGLRIAAEVKTGSGRIDAVIELTDHIYLFEFKLNQDTTVALDQVKEKAYYQKYHLHGKPITQVGANFDMSTRTVTDWQAAAVA